MSSVNRINRFGVLLQIRSLHDELQSLSGLEPRARRPYLDFERNDFTLLQFQLPAVSKDGLELGRLLSVQFAVRRPQPT